MGFLDKGSLLKHRNLGFLVRITDIQDERYILSWKEPPEDRLQMDVFRGTWSASELIREFSPQIPESPWLDRLVDPHIIDET